VEASAHSFPGNDPLVHQQWALEAIRGDKVHGILQAVQPQRKARVAIIDTGVDSGHEDLQSVSFGAEEQSFFGGLLDRIFGWLLDWLRSTFGAQDIAGDMNGHGTHCAGIAGAVTNNGLGIASLNWEGRFIEILPFKGLRDDGSGTMEQISQAVIDATHAEADVVSLSLGSRSPVPPRVLTNAIAFALRNGTIVAAAAGNSNGDASRHAPANIDGVIAVAAVDHELKKSSFSNTVGGLSRPLAAPGSDILSLAPNNDYALKSGTSMATPVVTGLLGLMRSIDPVLTATEAYNILHETGTEVEDTPQVGRVINAEEAVKAVRARL